MDKRGAKGYWISTAKIINQELFDEYVNKVGPWLKEVGGEVFAKDNQPIGKERTEDANLAVICEFPSMRAAHDFLDSPDYATVKDIRLANSNTTLMVLESL